MAALPTPEDFPSTPLAVLVADLSGYHRALRSHSDAEMAAFLDRFYRVCDEVVADEGGRVIKFMGDAVLATFPEDHVEHAVRAATRLEARAGELAEAEGYDLAMGANVHLGPVVAADLGGGASRRADIIGRIVNQTFLLGRGRGIRISERAYRRLPSSERTPWEKVKPPAFYVLGGTALS